MVSNYKVYTHTNTYTQRTYTRTTVQHESCTYLTFKCSAVDGTR